MKSFSIRLGAHKAVGRAASRGAWTVIICLVPNAGECCAGQGSDNHSQLAAGVHASLCPSRKELRMKGRQGLPSMCLAITQI